MTDVLAPERDPTEPGEPPGAPPPTPRPGDDRPAASGWFRAVWRWHFFASFLVVPVLLLLAVTGLIYLFRFQLEPLLHADLMKVDPAPAAGSPSPTSASWPSSSRPTRARPRSRWPSRATTDSPTIVSITTADGAGRDVYVDPYRSRCSARSTRTRPCRGTRSGCTAS